MKKVLKNSKGFTLMEVVVVLGILALLAAIMTPIVLDYLEEGKLNRARADCNAIYATVLRYYHDQKEWPSGTTDKYYYTGTTDPAAAVIGLVATTDGAALSTVTDINNYLERTDLTDPWGNGYVVAFNFTTNALTRAMVLSAGPDGVIDTVLATATTPTDDDIGRRIK